MAAAFRGSLLIQDPVENRGNGCRAGVDRVKTLAGATELRRQRKRDEGEGR